MQFSGVAWPEHLVFCLKESGTVSINHLNPSLRTAPEAPPAVVVLLQLTYFPLTQGSYASLTSQASMKYVFLNCDVLECFQDENYGRQRWLIATAASPIGDVRSS